MKAVYVAAAVLAVSSACFAADKVQVQVSTLKHKMQVAEYGGPDTLYPPRPSKEQLAPVDAAVKARRAEIEQQVKATEPSLDAAALKVKVAAAADGDAKLAELQKQRRALIEASRQMIDVEVPLVTLTNEHLEVKVLPTLGMRVLHAIDRTTGQSLAGTSDPQEWEKQPFSDVIGWTAGYVETSFPYFEHGMGVRQGAGYRVVDNADGSISVAMNLRFTHHQEPRHMARYGRYAIESLSHIVTLRPNEMKFTKTVRLDNPGPLRVSNRLWSNIIFDAEKYDGKHVIYPAGYVMPHGGQTLTPFLAEPGNAQYRNVSWFALYPEYGFGGVYRAANDTNSLVITDTREAPGLKLYTANSAGGIVEIWCGTTTLFEHPGQFTDPYVPTQFTMAFANVTGMGRVTYVNPHMAIAVNGESMSVRGFDASLPLDVKGPTNGGSSGSAGATITRAFAPGRYVVTANGKTLADVTLPLTYADPSAKHPPIKPLGGPQRIELEQITNHHGVMTNRDAIPAARKILAGGEGDPVYMLSLANVCYRYGHFDLALGLCEKIGKTPDTDYLRGLIAWEKAGSGENVDFASAGLDAHYHRALQAVAANEKKKAVEILDGLIAKRPNVYRPRLARSYLKQDAGSASALARENPASPEAQLVCELLGAPDAKAAREALTKDNPEAAEQVQAFREELTAGRWQHVRRYTPMLPQ